MENSGKRRTSDSGYVRGNSHLQTEKMRSSRNQLTRFNEIQLSIYFTTYLF